MKTRPTHADQVSEQAPAQVASQPGVDYRAHQVGTIVAFDAQGRPSVVFAGNLLVPTPARSTVAESLAIGTSVLLVFENGDRERPIIVGEMQPVDAQNETLEQGETLAQGDEKPQSLTFSAEKDITLKCGKSTLQLRRDGKILIRGSHILSRSSGPNRIAGASVNLN